MRHRILSVGIDLDLLTTRQALLEYHGYDCVTATPKDVYDKLNAGTFDLVILSLMLSRGDKSRILSALPPGTRPLALELLVMPDQLLRMVAEALNERGASG
jgi:DNA-binding response OmpR family regulator